MQFLPHSLTHTHTHTHTHTIIPALRNLCINSAYSKFGTWKHYELSKKNTSNLLSLLLFTTVLCMIKVLLLQLTWHYLHLHLNIHLSTCDNHYAQYASLLGQRRINYMIQQWQTTWFGYAYPWCYSVCFPLHTLVNCLNSYLTNTTNVWLTIFVQW